MAIRSLTVGIFDSSRDAERAVERLAAGGFDDTAYEDAAEDRGRVAARGAAVGAVHRPGAVSAGISGKPNLTSAFRSRLTEYRLPDEVIDGYAVTFDHGGNFILVRTHPQRDEEVVKILQKCGASRVNRYDR